MNILPFKFSMWLSISFLDKFYGFFNVTRHNYKFRKVFSLVNFIPGVFKISAASGIFELLRILGDLWYVWTEFRKALAG